MKKYLFLDVDGVLNKNNTEEKKWLLDNKRDFDRDCVSELNRIIVETDCYIVITSSWRVESTIENLKEIFRKRGFEYCNKIIDKTINISPSAASKNNHKWVEIPRGSEIKQWLMSFVVDSGAGYKKLNVDYNYAILDDCDDMLYEQRNNFVNTSYNTGLTKELADKVISILNQQ